MYYDWWVYLLLYSDCNDDNYTTIGTSQLDDVSLMSESEQEIYSVMTFIVIAILFFVIAITD